MSLVTEMLTSRVIYTWIYENIALEILPYVSFPCEIFLFIY